MATTKRLGYVVWAGVMLGLLAQSTWANDKHFKNAADRSRCESIITRDGIDACKKVQDAKNTACNRRSPCEPDKQEKWAKEYEELYKWWDSDERKKMPDNSFKSDKQRQMRDLVDKLKGGKAAAGEGTTIAKECIAARNAVQTWFDTVAIPLTERTRDELNGIRRTLVDKFNETKTRREDAKKKSADKPDDDSLKREWEAARDANIEAGRRLDEFDKTYGPDITYNADRLVRHYQYEKTNHDRPSSEAEGRLANCERADKVEWKSLPF